MELEDKGAGNTRRVVDGAANEIKISGVNILCGDNCENWEIPLNMRKFLVITYDWWFSSVSVSSQFVL